VLAEVDPDHFPRAVTNLLANANQHTPPTSAVEVSVRRLNGDVVVEVADHGPGIDPTLGDQLFERFTRADPSRSSASGGSGLGLAIAAAVAAAHGGRCEVRPTEGGGATFTLTVPAFGEPRTNGAASQRPERWRRDRAWPSRAPVASRRVQEREAADEADRNQDQHGADDQARRSGTEGQVEKTDRGQSRSIRD
jgi:Histidine kinase-, DNA gyrase B-, and HSP90-like ATPase